MSESAAVSLFGDADGAVGRSIRLAGESGALGRDALTVVGVAENTRYRELRADRPTIYLPPGRAPWPMTRLAIRTAEDNTAALLGRLSDLFGRVHPDIRVGEARTIEQIFDAPLARQVLTQRIMVTFAAVALVLAGVGIFAMLLFVVGVRTPEFGVRIAVGATPADLGALIARETILLVGIGLAFALLASLFGTRILESILFGVAPTDILTLAVSSLVVLAAAVVAAIAPIVKAARISPRTALDE